MNVKLPKGFISPEQFIGYCENKCEHQAVFFTGEEVAAIIGLADVPMVTTLSPCSLHKMQEEMQALCRQARYMIAKQNKKAGIKFDDKRFRHLQLVTNNG